MQLKGTTGKGSGVVKTKRVVEFKLRVLALKVNDGKTAKEALEIACAEFGVPLTQGMIDHPHSFVNMYKTSVNKGLSKGNTTLEAKVVQAGLAQDAPAPTPVEETEEPEEVEVQDEAEELEVSDNE